MSLSATLAVLLVGGVPACAALILTGKTLLDGWRRRRLQRDRRRAREILSRWPGAVTQDDLRWLGEVEVSAVPLAAELDLRSEIKLHQQLARYLREGFVDLLAQTKRRGRNVRRKEAAIHATLGIYDRGPIVELLPSLMVALTHPEIHVAAHAAEVLARNAAVFPGALVPLAMLVRESEGRRQIAMVWAFEKMIRAYPEMAQWVSRDPSPVVRRAIARAVAGVRRHDSFVQELCRKGLEDADPSVRSAYCEAAAEQKSFRGLEGVARNDPYEEVRLAAVRALGRASRLERREDAGSRLLAELLPSASHQAREEIVRTLEEMDGPASREVLDLVRTVAPARRGPVLLALGALGGELATAELVSSLAHPDEKVRWAAGEAIGRLARRDFRELDEGAVTALLQRLEAEQKPRVLQALLEAAAWTGDKRALPVLTLRIASAPPALRDRLIEATALLERLGRRSEVRT